MSTREMAERTRNFDWAKTPLGPRDSWPQSLRTAVDICLHSLLPMFVWWGPELINIHNDAYIPVLGKRHPDALGKPAREIWSEIWPMIAADVDGVVKQGAPILRERVRFVMERNGYQEETYFTYSHSPIVDESGRIQGLIQVCSDETSVVRAEIEKRRLETQRQLALDAAKLGWWRLNPATMMVTLDARAMQIFGVDDAQPSNAEIRKRIHPDDLPTETLRLQAALDPQDPQPYSSEYRILRTDGQTRWIEAHGSATFDGAGAERRITSFVGTVADITERVLAADQARTILESITEAFFAVDRDWRFTYANRQLEISLGCKREDLIGNVIWDVFPAILGKPFEHVYRKSMKERTPGTVRSYHQERGRWFDAQCYPAADGGLSIYFRDVTDRMLASEALEESNALLRGISDSTSDAIFAKDRDGRVRFANPAALAIFGKPSEEVLGRTSLELFDGSESAKAITANDKSVMESGVAIEAEESLRKADGSEVVYFSRRMPNRNTEGEIVGMLGVSRDVTEQRRAWDRTARLYKVAAALSEAVSPEDVAHVTVHQGIEAIGASAGSLALLCEDGVHLDMAGMVGYPPDAHGTWKSFRLDMPIPLAEAAGTGKPVFVETAEKRSALYPALANLHAERGTVSSASLPLTVGDRTIGSLGLSFDRPMGAFSEADREFMISFARQCAQALERARLFATERQARAAAEHAGRMKDEFLTTLSHELRTPLNAIVGWGTILATRAKGDRELQHGLSIIQRNAKAQTQIIEDLLDMSGIVSGKVRLDVQSADLCEVLQAAVDTVRPAAEAKNVRLNTVLDPQAGPVSGDPNRLHQVFWNLLSNAVKFTPKGGQVKVLLARVRSHVEVTVSDSGAGIDADFLPHVFDRFRQADASTTRVHGGLGLGLAIVKQLVELHGGTVHARSPGIGLGSTFVVELPLTALHAHLDNGGVERRHPSGGPWSPVPGEDPELRLDGVRILVVDDEADARALVKRVLEQSGAIVELATSAGEAFDSLVARAPDLLISDVGMPGEDGYALIRRVRALTTDRGGKVPAVALTAYARSEDRVRALRSGFQTHVVKPVDAAELLMVVASLTDRATPLPPA